MDEQELQRLLQQAQEEFRNLGSVSKETADKIAEASDASAKFKKQLMEAGAQFTRTMTGLAKSVGEGNTEFTVFNSVVDSVTSALSEMGKAVPFFGAAAVAAGEGAKFLLGQLQATTKAFNQVGAAGLLGADGMTGLRDQFVAAGIDLQLYSKVIAGNSEALARFGGIAGDGAARFSKALGQVNTDFGHQLMRLGNSFEDVAEQTASFITLQTRLGRSQNMSTSELAKGSFEYAKQLDELAKLTGQQKSQIIKQQDAAMSESRFRAKYEDLISKGKDKEAKAMLDFQTRVSAVSPVLGQGLRDIATGFVNTEAAQAAFISTGGRAATIMRQLADGTMSQEQAFAELQAANKQTLPMQRSLAMAVGDLPGVMIPFAQSADFANQKLADFGRAAGTQATQMERPDALTGSAVTAQKAMQEFSNAVTNFSTSLLPIAADAVGAFSRVTADGINSINRALNEFGGGRPVAVPQFADGGIARGPATGYSATLHGAEAVVPLPDGQKIPVEIKGLASDQLVKEMADYLAKANRMYLETIPMSRGGSALEAVTTSADYMREVNRLFEMAAVRAAEATERGVDYKQALAMKALIDRAGLMKELATGGITQGPSIAGEAGPEAVVPLPDGRTIPVEMQNMRFGGMGMDGSFQGAGTNVNMAGADFGSNIAGGMAREDITARVAELVESGKPLQESLKTTLTEFNAVLRELVASQGGGNQGEGMQSLMLQLVDLQRQQNATSSKILQSATN